MDILDRVKQLQAIFEEGPRSMNQEPRNMYSEGQLVQNTVDGSRPGYAGDDEVTKLAKEYQKVTGSETTLSNIKSRIRNNVITKELINKYKSRGAYGSGFRGKEIEAVTNPKFYKTVLSELNKVKKQRNKNVFFDHDDVIRTGKWYKNLRTKVGNLNITDLDTIIKKVLSEEFPGSYYGKNAMRDFRREKVVKAYLNYLDVNGTLDGGEKRLKELKIFQGTGKKQFRNINESFKEWTKEEFEVKGVDRKKLNPDQLKELKNWSPEYSTTKSVANEKQLKFLNDLNTNNLNLSTQEVRQRFFKKFPDVTEGAFNHRITHLTQLKNSGAYNQGGGNTKTFKWSTKGERAPWLKELLGLKFQGNYSSFINRGDKLLARGLTEEADRLYAAAEKYFGSNGVFTKYEGQGEHPFSRVFGSGPIGNELKINSLVRGDLNSFKRLNFDEPVIQLLTEYNKSTTLPERRNKIKTLIEDRKKLMNYLTESPNEKGIVESVKFNYGPKKMTASANVVDIDKVKNFNVEDYVKRGKSYLKSFETKGKNLFNESGQIIQKKLNPKHQMKLLKKMGYRCRKAGGGGESVACYMSDVEKTRADMKSSDVTVRAKALTKQRKALKLASKIPQIGKIIKTGVQLGTAAITKPLQWLGLTSGIGYAIEGIVEGGFYDNARRKGYNHEQAMAETLTPGLIAGRPEGVPWYGGAEVPREKELYEIKGKNEFIDVENRPPMQDPEFEKVIGTKGKVKQYIEALKDQERVYDAFARKEQGTATNIDQLTGTEFQRKDILDKASADIRDLAKTGTMENVNRIMNPESMASQAYNTAVENRDALDQRRRTEYLKKYDPRALEREKKSFDIYARDKEGKILYEKMNSRYKQRYKDMEKYKDGRKETFGFMSPKDWEKYQTTFPKYKNIPYEHPELPKFADYMDFLESKPEGYDKTYKELFPTPASRYDWDLSGEVARAGGVANMATGGRAGYMGGGMVGIRKPDAIPPEKQGLRSIMIGDMDD